jgi:hypothetical protein
MITTVRVADGETRLKTTITIAPARGVGTMTTMMIGPNAAGGTITSRVAERAN